MAVAVPTTFPPLASAKNPNRNPRNSSSTTQCLSLLKSCSNIRDFFPIHAHLITTNLIKDALIAKDVLQFFISIEKLDYAHLVFSRTCSSENIIWNTLIENQVQEDSPNEVISIYYHMVKQGVLLDVSTFHFLIHACSSLLEIQQGNEVHGRIVKSGLSNDRSLKNNLMGMYLKFGRTDEVRQLFERFPERDIISWNTMISCYVRWGLPEEALKLFWQMLDEGVRPDEVTMVSLVSACARLRDLNVGRRLHLFIEQSGLEIGRSLLNCLVNMYTKCGRIVEAQKLLGSNKSEIDVVSCTTLISGYVKLGKIDAARDLFDQMPEKNLISWTTMIAGYVQSELYDESLKLFSQMRLANVGMDEVAFVTAVSACAHVEDRELGKCIHNLIVKHGMSLDGFLGNTLIDMYVKCGLLDGAHMVFEQLLCPSVVSWNSMLDGYCKCEDVEMARAFFNEMPEKDVVSWNIMIACYGKFHRFKDLFDLFRDMQITSVKPNEVTMISLLASCAHIGSLDYGKWVHVYIEKNGIEVDTKLGTALVDMYAKCGSIERAFEVFSDVSKKNVFLWTSMIAAYSMEGQAKHAIDLYLEMEEAGMRPDEITFIALLSACSHGGLVNEGYKYFHRMSTLYNISPTIQHYGCMVDLLGRVGRLEEAAKFIANMPIEPDISIWSALIRACRTHHNVELAEHAGKHLLQMDPQNDAAYVLLSNIYAEANRWEDVGRMRMKLKELGGTRKQLGCSRIEENGVVHEFTAGDHRHPRSMEIYSMLSEMKRRLSLAVTKPNGSQVFLPRDEEEQGAPSHHSEKLAVAFGLISNARRTPIRIVNNLRICGDCHSAMKLLSQVYEREIVIRDNYRFHRFRDGSCSCRDYW